MGSMLNYCKPAKLYLRDYICHIAIFFIKEGMNLKKFFLVIDGHEEMSTLTAWIQIEFVY